MFDNKVYPVSTSISFYSAATQLTSSAQRLSETKPEPLRIIRESRFKEFNNALVNSVVSLANETTRAGYGALVFCSSRLGCERDALLISQVLASDASVDPSIMDKRKELLVDLGSTGAGLDHTLEQTIVAGVAFHRTLILPAIGNM